MGDLSKHIEDINNHIAEIDKVLKAYKEEADKLTKENNSLSEQIEKLAEENDQLKARCKVQSRGVLCMMCDYECNHRASREECLAFAAELAEKLKKEDNELTDEEIKESLKELNIPEE